MASTPDKLNELRATLSKMEVALGAVEHSIIWTNSIGEIRWCNASFESFCGQLRVFLLGQMLTEKLVLYRAGEIINQTQHPVNIALSSKQSGQEKYDTFHAKKYANLSVSWHYVEIIDAFTKEEDTSSAVIVIQDITRQTRSEHNLLFAKLQLEEKTEELTQANTALKEKTARLEHLLSELQKAQANLVQSEKMYSLGLMTAGIAHEINNPVNFIHGNLQHLHSYCHSLIDLIEVYEKKVQQPDEEIRRKAQEVDYEFIRSDLPKILDSMATGTERIREILYSLQNKTSP
jgi:signal transduction histidine kinase